jgi:hypothetical protein
MEKIVYDYSGTEDDSEDAFEEIIRNYISKTKGDCLVHAQFESNYYTIWKGTREELQGILDGIHHLSEHEELIPFRDGCQMSFKKQVTR